MDNNLLFIDMRNILKTFGKVVANKDVNLKVKGGEIHALLGENGAGKSTLMNMLSGVYTPDAGDIFIHGVKINFTSPKDAIKSGVGMIYQHFKLVENMTAEENILLGQKHGLFLNKKAMREKIARICEKYGLELSLNKMIYDMSVGEKQTLEILKVLYRGADILILDEPTTVFTPQEAEKLFKMMNKMKENGCAVIFITHKMDEVMAVSDRISVLRKGETVATLETKDTNPQQLAELMVGRPVELSIERPIVKEKNVVLEVKDLKVRNEENLEVLKGISFQLRSGEILGIAGIANSGQKEICEAISGIMPIASGQVLLEKDNLVGKNPREIIKKGISMSFIPEDRLGMGLVGSMDMVDNLLLKTYHNQKGLLLDTKATIDKANEIKEKLEIKTPSIFYPIKNLSGGNIQKILLGRELDSNPHVLIMAYPVRGLDINTCYKIYDLMNEQKKKGVGVLFIGEDLDVLLQLCDRIMVVYNGEITGIVEADKTTKEQLGLLMSGNRLQKEGMGIA